MKKLYEVFCKICDVPKLVRRVWLILWLTLLIFVIAKLCFNIWYPITIDNENMLKIFAYMDNHRWLDLTIRCILYELNSILIFKICLKDKKIKVHWLILFFLIFAGSFVFKTFDNLAFIGTIIELTFGLIVPIIINIKTKLFRRNLWNVLYPVIMNVIITLWQANILFIRGINEILTNAPSLIGITLQIDYYIFLIITWIGVRYYMGNLGWWLFGKDVTALKAEKEKELAKENPNMEKIAEIDKAIVKLELEAK